MRRPKREVKDMEEIKKIIEECSVCRLGLYDEGKIYMVPMNFGYEYEDNTLYFYVHSAKVGRKIEVVRRNPEVGIELDCRHGLMEAEEPCGHSYYFASLTGTGCAQILEKTAEKIHGLKILMKHQTGRDFTEFDDKWVNAVEVIRIRMEEYACKHHDGTN